MRIHAVHPGLVLPRITRHFGYSPGFGSTNSHSDKTWQEPSKLRVSLDALLKALIVVRLLVLGGDVMPKPPAIQPVVTQVISAIDEPTYRLFQVLAAEMLLYLLLKRRKIFVAHEFGHAITYQVNDAQLGFPTQPEDASAKALEMKWYGAVAHPTSSSYRKEMIGVITRIKAARKSGQLYDPSLAHDRAALQSYYRNRAMALVAGPMLEGYLMGRILPIADLSDKHQLNYCIKYIAMMEKPKKDWTPGERHQFRVQEKKQAYQSAKAFLTGFDFSKMKATYQQLVNDLKSGKTSWNDADLQQMLNGLV